MGKTTVLEKIRQKLHTRAAAVFATTAIVAGSCGGIKNHNDKTEQQKIENRQSMKQGWKALYSKADMFMSDEEKGIYMAVYTIPEDLQKDLAVEYDYMTQTRTNIETRLRHLDEVEKNASRLSDLGYKTGINVKDSKEYKVLSEIIKEMPTPPEIVMVLAKNGNAVNKIDLYGRDDINFYDTKGTVFSCGTTIEGYKSCEGLGFCSAKRCMRMLSHAEISGEAESATSLAQNQVKLMRETMLNVEKKLHDAGLDEYLGKKNENMKVERRQVNLYDKTNKSSKDKEVAELTIVSIK